jgi:hypothetical protein
LHELRRLCKDEVSKIVCGIKFHLQIKGHSIAFWHDGLVSRAINACRLTTEELRERGRNRNRSAGAKLPMPPRFVELLRQERWVSHGDDWVSARALDARMSYLAVSYGYDRMSRISNLAKPDSKDAEDHAIRSCDVYFVLDDGSVRSASETKGLSKTDVVYVSATEYTSKTNTTGKAHEAVFGGKSQQEREFVEDMLEWSQRSGFDRHGMFFSRTSCGSMKRLTAKMVSEAIKHAASTCGFDPSAFGTHSMRHGGCAVMEALNESARVSESRGGWTEHSKTREEVYALVAGVQKTRGPRRALAESTGALRVGDPNQVRSVRARKHG